MSTWRDAEFEHGIDPILIEGIAAAFRERSRRTGGGLELPDSVTCYIDSTVALPLLTAYALTRVGKRPLKRLTDRLPELTRRLEAGYAQTRADRTE